MGELDIIEKKALEQAAAAEAQKERTEALEIAKTIIETRKLAAETEKIRLDAKEVSREYKFGRAAHWASMLTPLLAVALTALTLYNQSRQFSETAKLQADGSEESEWRDAVKNLSMKDARTTLLGAFSMHGFFNSPNHANQARTIAATLLPHVDISDGFDNIFFDILDATNASNQVHVVAIGKTLFNLQMDLFRVSVLANRPSQLDFQTLREMLGDDDPPDFISKESASRLDAGARAWMLDSVSDGLSALWTNNKAAGPRGLDLGGVVLEDGQFNDLDFSNTNLQGGALFNADFKRTRFAGATFTRKLVSNVTLDEADLSGVKNFEESKWEHANWWKAKCISRELLEYLKTNDATASPENKQEGNAISCH